MTDNPQPPFQPPDRPGGPQDPRSGPGRPVQYSRKPGGGYSLLGLLVGVVLGLLGPPFIGGFSGALLASAGVADGAAITVAILLAVGLVVAAFVVLIRQLDEHKPNQAAMRSGVKVAGYVCLALWGVGLLVFGACVALIAEAY